MEEITTGKKLKQLRQRKNQKQSQIAKELGISVPAYSKLETDITDINLSRLLQLATLYEVTPASLLPGEDTNIHYGDTIAGYKDTIANLNSKIVKLQARMIELYEEIGDLKAGLHHE